MIQGLFGYGGPARCWPARGARCSWRPMPTRRTTQWRPYALGHATYVWGDLDAAASLLGKAGYNEAAPAVIQILQPGDAVARGGGARTPARRAANWPARRCSSSTTSDSVRCRSCPWRSPRSARRRPPRASLEAAMESLEEGLILRRRQPEQGPWGVLHHLLGTARVAVAAGRLAPSAGAGRRGWRSEWPGSRRAWRPMTSRLEAIQGALRARLGDSELGDPLTGTRARCATPATGLAEPPRHRARAVPLRQHRQDPHQRRSTASSAPIRGRRPSGSLARASCSRPLARSPG